MTASASDPWVAPPGNDRRNPEDEQRRVRKLAKGTSKGKEKKMRITPRHPIPFRSEIVPAATDLASASGSVVSTCRPCAAPPAVPSIIGCTWPVPCASPLLPESDRPPMLMSRSRRRRRWICCGQGRGGAVEERRGRRGIASRASCRRRLRRSGVRSRGRGEERRKRKRRRRDENGGSW